MAEKLFNVRRMFVEKVSMQTLCLLLDDVFNDRIVNDMEREYVTEENKIRADTARRLIDLVRKKGDKASNKMIAHIQRRDPELASVLGLSCDQRALPAPIPKMDIRSAPPTVFYESAKKDDLEEPFRQVMRRFKDLHINHNRQMPNNDSCSLIKPLHTKETTVEAEGKKNTIAVEKKKDEEKILQKCPCGWERFTTTHGLRIHQGKGKCVQKDQQQPCAASPGETRVTKSHRADGPNVEKDGDGTEAKGNETE